MHLPKFEDTAALKHHCGICQTPFTNPNALLTCVGKHEVLCANYHPMFHFIGKEHTCNACNKTEKVQRERHRAILKLLKSYREENGDDDAAVEDELVLSPVNSIHSEKLRRKDRKAQKKATRSSNKFDIIKQSDLEMLRDVIHPWDDATNDADRFLADALALKFMPNIFAEKRIMDAIMTLPKERPDLEGEADRVIAALDLGEPQTKDARNLLASIRKAIEQDIEIQWGTDVNMRRRRIIYAQWVTQGAVDNSAKQYEDWDLTASARTRRYQGDSQGHKAKDQYEDDLDDELSEQEESEAATFESVSSHHNGKHAMLDPSTPVKRSSKLPRNKSPLNDTRRGGKALHPSRYSLYEFPDNSPLWGSEFKAFPSPLTPSFRSRDANQYRAGLKSRGARALSSVPDFSVKSPTPYATPSPGAREYLGSDPSSPETPTQESVWRKSTGARSLSRTYDHDAQLESPMTPILTGIKALRLMPSTTLPMGNSTDNGDWSTVKKRSKAPIGSFTKVK